MRSRALLPNLSSDQPPQISHPRRHLSSSAVSMSADVATPVEIVEFMAGVGLAAYSDALLSTLDVDSVADLEHV